MEIKTFDKPFTVRVFNKSVYIDGLGKLVAHVNPNEYLYHRIFIDSNYIVLLWADKEHCGVRLWHPGLNNDQEAKLVFINRFLGVTWSPNFQASEHWIYPLAMRIFRTYGTDLPKGGSVRIIRNLLIAVFDNPKCDFSIRITETSAMLSYENGFYRYKDRYRELVTPSFSTLIHAYDRRDSRIRSTA